MFNCDKKSKDIEKGCYLKWKHAHFICFFLGIPTFVLLKESFGWVVHSHRFLQEFIVLRDI